jgi:hypothetical protein
VKDSRNLRVYAEFFYCSGSSSDILYAKLLKEEILQCDKELLKAAKKAGSIGGKTGSVRCDPEVLLVSRKYCKLAGSIGGEPEEK